MKWTPLCAALIAGTATGQTAWAQDKSNLTIEFNRASPLDAGCRLTFVARNQTDRPLEKAAFEIVLFDDEGLVDRLTVFNFGRLPQDRTTVRQFDLADTACDKLSRVLINGTSACEAETGAVGVCDGALQMTNKTDIAFGG